MTSLTIGSNIASLTAQREVSKTTNQLSRSFERLSSGLRINRASDDAAGLAVATGLNTKARVYSQAIRNANDGISLVNTAESAVNELTSILSRLNELATQAANGSLTRIQRVAIDKEGAELQEEYNRIINNSEFNSLSLLDGSFNSTTLQVSDDSSNNITFEVGEELVDTVGDGTFTSGTDVSSGLQTTDFELFDINGDGNLDIIATDINTDSVMFHLGNGDGTFAASTSMAVGLNPYSMQLADMNGDGNIDIVATAQGVNGVSVLLGNGDGTFNSVVTSPVAVMNGDLQVGDFDNDGNNDVIIGYANGDDFYVALGNGDGTFGSVITTFLDASTSITAMEVGDYNGDGILDAAMTEIGNDTLLIMMGNGDGSFKSAAAYAAGSGSNPYDLEQADLNFDGITDIVVSGNNGGELYVYLGNADGSFAAGVTYAGASDPGSVGLADINGDGFIDILSADEGADSFGVLLGDGTGSFGALQGNYAGSDYGFTYGDTVEAGDIDGDGAIDVVIFADTDQAYNVFLGNTQEQSVLPRLNLTNVEGALAAIPIIEEAQDRVTSELGNLGANGSRLDSTTTVLTNIRDAYVTAESRIMDLDVAAEVAEMVRLQVLQQAGAAVLAQANANPQIALSLLSTGS